MHRKYQLNPKQTEEIKLLDKIFKQVWICECDKLSLSFIRTTPDIDNVFIKKSINWGSCNFSTGVTRTETNNDRALIEMFLNQSKVDVGSVFNEKMNFSQTETVNLTIADISEILYNSGSLSLLNPIDCVEIYSTICNYIKMVTDKSLYEPHYVAPPQEDMDAFEKLKSMVEQLASSYMDRDMGNDIFTILSSLMPTTAVGVKLNKEKEKMKLDGKNSNITIGTNSVNSKSLYDFL